MATSTVRDTLTKIESLLGATVGVTKMVEMTPTEFVAHAHSEIAKAATESGAASTRRLKSLLTAVTIFKDNYVDGESESVKVPITYADTTAIDEKQNQLMDAAKTPAAQNASAFAQGFVAKVADLSKLVESLTKASVPDEPTEGGASGATRGGDDDEEENEKARKALEDAGLHKAAAKFKPKPKAKTDGEEGGDATGATAAEPPSGTPEDDDEEKDDDTDEEKARKKAARAAKAASVTKGLRGPDVSSDGTEWPSDLAESSFDKDGKPIKKSLDWGRDGAK